MTSNRSRGNPGAETRLACELVNLFGRHIPLYVREQLPPHVVRADRAIPVGLDGEVLVVATEDPGDVACQNRIRYIADRELRVVAATRDGIDHAISSYYAAENEEEHDGLT